jgi:hypothetical protein
MLILEPEWRLRWREQNPLRRFRKINRLSLADVAIPIDVAPNTVLQWESGAYCPAKKFLPQQRGNLPGSPFSRLAAFMGIEEDILQHLWDRWLNKRNDMLNDRLGTKDAKPFVWTGDGKHRRR